MLQLRVVHVAALHEWDRARAAGRYDVSSRGRTLADEGFIHASTRSQLGGVLDRYYADLDPGGLRLLVIDLDLIDRAGTPVQWDDVPGQPRPFPHLYGPIVPSAVVAVLPLGTDLTPWDVAP